jgi:hypothetical protein
LRGASILRSLRAAITVPVARHCDPSSKVFRYYDGLLYMTSLLHASGRFQVIRPAPPRRTVDRREDGGVTRNPGAHLG